MTIKNAAGSHFDPELVAVFIQQLPRILEIKQQFADQSFSTAARP